MCYYSMNYIFYNFSSFYKLILINLMFKRTERSASAQALRSVLLPRIKLTAEGK